MFFKTLRLKRWNFSKCWSTKHKHRSASTKHPTKSTPNNHLKSRLKKKKKNPSDQGEKEFEERELTSLRRVDAWVAQPGSRCLGRSSSLRCFSSSSVAAIPASLWRLFGQGLKKELKVLIRSWEVSPTASYRRKRRRSCGGSGRRQCRKAEKGIVEIRVGGDFGVWEGKVVRCKFQWVIWVSLFFFLNISFLNFVLKII